MVTSNERPIQKFFFLCYVVFLHEHLNISRYMQSFSLHIFLLLNTRMGNTHRSRSRNSTTPAWLMMAKLPLAIESEPTILQTKRGNEEYHFNPKNAMHAWSNSNGETKRKLASFEPSEALSFALIPSSAPVTVLNIQNTSLASYIAFRIGCANMHRYIVRTTTSLLGPGRTAAVAIILRQEECQLLLENPATQQDTFLVQLTQISEDFFRTLTYMTKPTQESEDEMHAYWNHISPHVVQSKLLLVNFARWQCDSP